MTDYERKWLWRFIAAEAVVFAFCRLLVFLFDMIPTSGNELISGLVEIITSLITPALLIVTAFVVMYKYKNGQTGGGSL